MLLQIEQASKKLKTNTGEAVPKYTYTQPVQHPTIQQTIVEWIGEPFYKRGYHKYYKSFKYNDETISIGDCVYLNPAFACETGDAFWICMIQEAWEDGTLYMLDSHRVVSKWSKFCCW